MPLNSGLLCMKVATLVSNNPTWRITNSHKTYFAFIGLGPSVISHDYKSILKLGWISINNYNI